MFINYKLAHVIFGYSASHSFIKHAFVIKHNIPTSPLKSTIGVGTGGSVINVATFVKEIPISIGKYELN